MMLNMLGIGLCQQQHTAWPFLMQPSFKLQSAAVHMEHFIPAIKG
jgi:hypothetical protein